MSLPVLIIGAGGHGKVIADALTAMGSTVLGFVDSDSRKWGTTVAGYGVLGGDDLVSGQAPGQVRLANGIGSVKALELRRKVFEQFCDRGYRFMTVVHPKAVVSPLAQLRRGAQIMAGAVVQADAHIGANSIINTGALVDHDCLIGQHCHIAPGCVLSGDIQVGDESHIGTGSSIRQGVRLGRWTVVGVGAVVVANFEGSGTLIGVPARVMR